MKKILEEINKLSYLDDPTVVDDNDGNEVYAVYVEIPEWEVSEVVNLWEDDEKWYVCNANCCEEEFFYKEEFTLDKALKNFYKPVEDSDDVCE